MAAAVAQHAAESELFVTGELAAANRPNKLVVSVCVPRRSSPFCVSFEALADAIAIAAIFNIVTRYADALEFIIPTSDEFDRAAGMLLKRGYAS